MVYHVLQFWIETAGAAYLLRPDASAGQGSLKARGMPLPVCV
jgi:hypothetical protein